MPAPISSDLRLVNGSAGDPGLLISFPGRGTAILFDAGENSPLSLAELGTVEALFITHHHTDHFAGLDRIVRANLNQEKTLHVFGPDSTIKRVQQRLSSYLLPRFDFMKLVVQVHDVLPDRLRLTRLACAKDFALEEITENPWGGPLLYSNEDVTVETCPTEHTVPGLAFALVEKTGFQPDPRKLASGLFRPGPWVAEALSLLRNKAKADTLLTIDGLEVPLGWLRDRFFLRSQGPRVAYVVDTLLSDTSRPALLKLAWAARRFYCDSYYSTAQAKAAATHKHMTAAQAGELARASGAEELVLIHFAPRYVGRYHTLIEEARAAYPGARAELSRES
jgi:ribonuclease Z